MKKNFYKDNRQLKYGGFSIALTVLVILAVLALNVFAANLENDKGLKVDFTPAASYTLDKNAETAVNDLTQDVIIYTFIPHGESSSYSAMTQNVVSVFAGAGDRISTKNVDPVVNPSKLRQFSSDTKELSTFAVVVAQADDETNYYAFNENELVEFNSRTQKRYFVLQRWITSALINMRTGVRQNVYVLTGHGEDYDGMEVMYNRIRREGLNVEPLDLTAGGDTLNQGDIIVLLQPTSDLSKDEYDRLIRFLDEGFGKMMILASRLADDAGNPLTNYNNLLDYFNMSLADGVVAETDAAHQSTLSSKSIEVVADQAHEITALIRSGNNPVWVSEAGSFSYRYAGSSQTTALFEESFTPLVTSYASAVLVPWQQADEFDASQFSKGVQTVGAAYERTNLTLTAGTSVTNHTRILLLGSEDFGTGDYLGNSNLLRNGINWLAGKKSADSLQNVGIDLTASYMQMTKLQMNIWYAILVIAVPALVFLAGIIVWIRRKNL